MNQKLHDRAQVLVHSLSNPELNLLKTLLSTSKNPPEEENKLTSLLNVLVQEGISVNETFEDEKGKDSTRKNLEALEERLLDSLLMDANLDRGGRYKRKASYPLVLQKDRMKAELLSARGVGQRSFQRLKRTIERYIEVEDFGSAISCIQLQMGMVCLQSSPKEFNNRRELLLFLKREQQLRDRATDLFVELKMKKYYGILENLDVFIETSLSILRRDVLESNSCGLQYVLLYFEKEEAEMKGDLFGALHRIHAMLDVLEQTFYFPQVRNPYELVYEQARLLLEMDCRSLARDLLYKTKERLPLENEFGQNTLELLYVHELSQGRLQEAEKLLSALLSSAYFDQHMPREVKRKWYYFKAILLFRLNRSKALMAFISRYNWICDSYSAEQKAEIKVMEILSAIDLMMLDKADRLQDALRKFIKRNGLRSHIEKTYLFELIELLWQLKYCGYDLKRLDERKIDLTLFCSRLEEAYLNLSARHSLSRLDLWFARKVKKQTKETDLYYLTLSKRRSRYFETGVLNKRYI